MNQRIGRYITQKTSEEFYKAYIPPKMPLNPPIDLIKLYPKLEKATLALAQLMGNVVRIFSRWYL